MTIQRRTFIRAAGISLALPSLDAFAADPSTDGGDDEHHDIGDIGAAGAHIRENGMARGIEEGDFLVVMDYLIGADVLGNAAGLAGGDFSFAEEIED